MYVIADVTNSVSEVELENLIHQGKELSVNAMLIKNVDFDLRNIRNIMFKHEIHVGCYVNEVTTIELVEILNPDFYYIPESDFENIPLIKQIISTNRIFYLSISYNTSLDVIKQVVSFISSKTMLFRLMYNSYNDNTSSITFLDDFKALYDKLKIGYNGCNIVSNVISVYKGIDILMYPLNNDNAHKFTELMSELVNLKLVLQKNYRHETKLKKRFVSVTTNLKKNQILNQSHLTLKYDFDGISAIYIDDIIGCVVKYDLSADHILKWSDLYIIY